MGVERVVSGIFILIYFQIASELDTYLSYTDADLLKLLSENDVAAFDLLYTRHWADMYKSAFTILREQEACKDIVQDVFVWLWTHRHTLMIQSPKSYFNAAVKFKVANYIRNRRARESLYVELAKYNPTGESGTIEEIAEIKELKVIIQQAILDLPEKCREIFRLKREEHLSNKEIADRLGISVKTVENQMTIALSKIRHTLEPYMIMVPVLNFLCFKQFID